jgi:uridylate kinase
MKRILVKLSGEMLQGNEKCGIEQNSLQHTALMLQSLKKEGYEIGVVIGGGNIFRGVKLASNGLNRTAADQMGMLATLINGVALKTALESINITASLFSAVDCPKVAETYQYDKVKKAFQSGHLVIFVGGTGNPFFTTDTAAALRAVEIEADLIVKATKVDGVFDKDPSKEGAKKYINISYNDYLAQKLGVMDLTAITLCFDNQIPIFVTNMKNLGKTPLKDLISKQEGTLIKG